MTSAYLLQGLGPILSAGGAAAGGWLFGQNGQPGAINDIWGGLKDIFGWGSDNDYADSSPF
jgi:hypothetical protein